MGMSAENLKSLQGVTNHQLVLECFTKEALEEAIAKLQKINSTLWEALYWRATSWEFRPFNRFFEVPEGANTPSDFDLMVELFPDFEKLALKLKSEKPEIWNEMLARSTKEKGFLVFSCWSGLM